MFTFNKLKVENFKKKELNKQHISSFLCISLFFLSEDCGGAPEKVSVLQK